MSNFLGDSIDNIATLLGLPEIGLSESVGGGATTNTGRVNYDPNVAKAVYGALSTKGWAPDTAAADAQSNYTTAFLNGPSGGSGTSLADRLASDTNSPSLVSGAGTGTSGRALDTAQLASLDSLLASYDTIRNQAKQKATIARDTSRAEKEQEKKNEETKYGGKKVATLQDFASAKTDTDLNTKNTLENIISSLSTMGLGGSRALTRQILDAANMSNRKANATQAKDNQGLDTAFNEYTAGNENDMRKIEDQFGFDTGEADRSWGQNRQNALYKKADVYNAANDTGGREAVMNEGNDLNSFIANAAFMNPSYKGETKAMATPELGDYTQNIAKYDTTAIGATPGGLTPVGATATTPGNLAVRAIAVNDKDFGIKKKQESELGYGV
jgi:hypothetical protein